MINKSQLNRVNQLIDDYFKEWSGFFCATACFYSCASGPAMSAVCVNQKCDLKPDYSKPPE